MISVIEDDAFCQVENRRDHRQLRRVLEVKDMESTNEGIKILYTRWNFRVCFWFECDPFTLSLLVAVCRPDALSDENGSFKIPTSQFQPLTLILSYYLPT